MQYCDNKVEVDVNKLKDYYQEYFKKKNLETYDDICNNKIVKNFIFEQRNSEFNHKIDQEKFAKLIKNLPNNKAVGISDVSYEMVKYANNQKLNGHLRAIFEAIINFQTMPYLFNISIIKPLIKDPKKPNNDITNLRPVAISDCLSNLFESILLDMLNDEHNDHFKQFGFKKNSSCQHAVWTAKQAIEKCVRTRKWAYICAIDASKAFDKVNRIKLWKELIKKKLSPCIIINLIKYYDISLMLVNNNDFFSTIFKTEVGVRQGGKASPKLFAIYTEKFLDRISKSDLGVKLSYTKIDIIAYADDLLLISNTKKALQEMLDIISEVGKELEIKFNPNKTVYTVFNRHVARTSQDRKDDLWQNKLCLEGEEIKRVDGIKYLGVELNQDLNDIHHIDKKIKAARIALAKLKTLEVLTQNTSAFLKGHLYKTYIMPVLYFGLENINLTIKNIKTVQKAENNLLRYTFYIPKRCRISNLKLANNLNNTGSKLKSIQIEFFERLMNNKYTKSIIKDLLLDTNDTDYISKILNILAEIECADNIDLIGR
ncbi:unnamed protein product, partial [Brachionus calyciflorus]